MESENDFCKTKETQHLEKEAIRQQINVITISQEKWSGQEDETRYNAQDRVDLVMNGGHFAVMESSELDTRVICYAALEHEKLQMKDF